MGFRRCWISVIKLCSFIPIVYFFLLHRGAISLLVAALQTKLRLAVAQAKYCNSFQLTHKPRGNHAQSIASNGDQKKDKTLLQYWQLSQHGEFWHVSVSERQRLRLCGQNFCGPFVWLYWQPTSKRAIEQWRPTARQKRLNLHHQGEFQHNYYAFV